jgi:RNA polymerase sigma factor (sigma-70 family)
LCVVRRILGPRHPDVEDVAQEAIMASIESLGSFRRQCTVLHFVWRVAALTAMNARRRLQLRAQIAQSPAAIDGLVSEESPMKSVLSARRREAFRRLLDELPPVQSEVLALHTVLGFTIAEVAAAAGVPANTVRSRLLNAKAALRKRLGEDPELHDLVRDAL